MNRNWRAKIAPMPRAAVDRMRSGRFLAMITSMKRIVTPGSTSTSRVHSSAMQQRERALQRKAEGVAEYPHEDGHAGMMDHEGRIWKGEEFGKPSQWSSHPVMIEVNRYRKYEIKQFDYEQAERELTGESDFDKQQAVFDFNEYC